MPRRKSRIIIVKKTDPYMVRRGNVRISTKNFGGAAAAKRVLDTPGIFTRAQIPRGTPQARVYGRKYSKKKKRFY